MRRYVYNWVKNKDENTSTSCTGMVNIPLKPTKCYFSFMRMDAIRRQRLNFKIISNLKWQWNARLFIINIIPTMYAPPPYGAPTGYGAPPPNYYAPPPPVPQQGPVIINIAGAGSSSGTACPTCRKDTPNIPRKKVGCVTVAWCLCLLFTVGGWGLCLIPCCCNDNCKDTELVCQICQGVKQTIKANCCWFS